MTSARFLLAAALVAVAVPVTLRAEDRAALVEGETWAELRGDVAGEVELLDGEGLYSLEAPFRAEDAATVPIRFVQAEGAPNVRKMTLVIDENPSPVAAEFTFGSAMQPVDLETRVRVDAYSNVRVIVEAEDGRTYMTGRYVRASGGCSAPASKDAAAALAALGQMRARWFEEAPLQAGVRREAQVMLRHPNYSGLQRNQVTHLFVPPHFVDTLEVRQGEEMLFSMTGGISISEDPTFRFSYVDSGAGALSIRASDTEGALFEQTFPFGA